MWSVTLLKQYQFPGISLWSSKLLEYPSPYRASGSQSLPFSCSGNSFHLESFPCCQERWFPRASSPFCCTPQIWWPAGGHIGIWPKWPGNPDGMCYLDLQERRTAWFPLWPRPSVVSLWKQSKITISQIGQAARAKQTINSSHWIKIWTLLLLLHPLQPLTFSEQKIHSIPLNWFHRIFIPSCLFISIYSFNLWVNDWYTEKR